MADSPTQDGRVGKLATPLGKDKLCLTRFEGSEAIGELFEYRIEAVSTDADLSFNAALGQNCSVHLETTDHVGRDFSGILTEVKWAGMRSNLPLYRLVLRPWPWIMSLRSHCRIFANMNVKDIIKDALGNDIHGPIVDLMIEDYPTLEYTVQYRETSLNFALRMMEKFGIYYYFKFDQGDGDSPSPHYLVLADSTTHEKLPAPKSVLYVPPSAAGPDDTQLFNDWSREQAVIAGIFELNDYDYNKPNANLETHEAHFTPPGESIIHDYPGGYDDKALGDRLTKVRQEAERVFEDRASAAGYAPSLTPGFSIQRTSQNGDSQDDNYLILRCNHWYGDQSYASEGSGQGADGAYSGSYELSRISRSLSDAAANAPACDHWVAAGEGHQQRESGDRRRQTGARAGRVLLGRHDRLDPGQEDPLPPRPRRADLGGSPTRRAVHSPRGRRSDGGIRGWRSRSADHCRLGVQWHDRESRKFGFAHPARQEDHERRARKVVHRRRLDDP